MLLVATLSYAVNCAIGLAAQLGGLRFGWVHHAAYAIVFAAALACLVLRFHPALCIVVAALAAFPRARPHTWQHPTLACIGALGYLLTWTC